MYKKLISKIRALKYHFCLHVQAIKPAQVNKANKQ